jgi:hypothetical protein
VGWFPADAHNPQVVAFSRDHDLSVLNSGKAEWRKEIAQLVNEGQSYASLTLKFPIFNGDGEVDGLGAIATDITANVHAEGKLRKNNALINQAEQFGKLGHWEWDEIASRSLM